MVKNTKTKYSKFIKNKKFHNVQAGFKPLWLPDFLFDFQKEVTEWAIRRGRAALFEDCGLGKTPQQLVWAENVIRKTNGYVLIVTPLAVSHQTIREAKKFNIEVRRSSDGKLKKGINVTNYERLKLFNPSKLSGFVADESSILKHEDAETRKLITSFVHNTPYRLLCTATPAPNDFMELGTSAEALGVMKYNQMLSMFFTHCSDNTSQWLLKSHAKKRFWEWVSTWAKALRKPSDINYKDRDFKLPSLNYTRHIVKSQVGKKMLFACPAVTMDEQRKERKKSLNKRCEKSAQTVMKQFKEPWVLWTHLNAEADLLENLIPNSEQVCGSMSDEEKEERFIAFTDGQIKHLITKPKIGGFGMNWQHCWNISYFPDHSYEKFYQCIRRCWRFGQKNKVHCHIISSEGQSRIVQNMLRKERQSNEMYNGIIRNMSEFQNNKKHYDNIKKEKVKKPSWM